MHADNRIVNIMKVYIERNKEQVELIRYRKNVDFIHVYFCEATDSMQYRPTNVNQEFANTNHFGSISDSFGRLSASSEYMASVKTLNISLGIMMYLNLISTALAENTLTKMDIANRAVIPPHLAPGRLINFSADNIDINDCTLDRLGRFCRYALR